MQRQSLRPGLGVHAGVSKAWRLRPRRSHSSSVQTTFKESMTWARKKPLAGAGRQGLGMLAPQVVKTCTSASQGTAARRAGGRERGKTCNPVSSVAPYALMEPAFFDDRHLVHGGSVTRCHLARDSSGQQDMQEVRWTEHSLQDRRGAHQSERQGDLAVTPPSGYPPEAPPGSSARWSQGGWETNPWGPGW